MTDRSIKKMSPRTRQQIEALKTEKRRLILDAALYLFAKKGFHATTINDIAVKANIAKGLLYNYFSSKEEVLKQIVYDWVNEITVLFDPDHDGILTASELDYFLENYCNLLREKQAHWRLYYSLMFQSTVLEISGAEKYTEIAQDILSKLAAYLKRNGFSNAEEETQMLHCLFDGFTLNYIFHPDEEVMKQFKHYIKEKYIKPCK